MNQQFRNRPQAGPKTPGLPGAGQKELKPVDASKSVNAMDDFLGDMDKMVHDSTLAAMTDEEREDLEQTDEEESQGQEGAAADPDSTEEGQDEDQEEGQKGKRRGPRYICYCGDPRCNIGFFEGRQLRNDERGVKNKDGSEATD